MPRTEGLGERIQKLRGMVGISARELDGLAGLQAGHTRAIETGSKGRVAARTLSQLAAVFGVSLDWLYGGGCVAPKAADLRKSVDRAKARRERLRDDVER